jgi:hypothetical protein
VVKRKEGAYERRQADHCRLREAIPVGKGATDMVEVKLTSYIERKLKKYGYR